MNEVMKNLGSRDIVIWGDMNIHVDNDKIDYDRVYKGHGFEGRNESEEKVLDFASAYVLVILNTFF